MPEGIFRSNGRRRVWLLAPAKKIEREISPLVRSKPLA